MSVKRHLRTILTCALLEAGALMGAAMRVEQLQELLRALSQPKIAQTNPEEDPKGDPPRA